MKVEVAIMGSLSLIVHTVSVDGKATLNLNNVAWYQNSISHNLDCASDAHSNGTRNRHKM